MEKKLYELKIDEEFRTVLPPPAKNEMEGLEKEIIRDGCTDPLIVWNGIIVDGYHRYEICTKNMIPFAVEEREFDSREEVKLWIISHQMNRRNLTDYQRCEVIMPLRESFIERAEEERRKLISDYRKSRCDKNSDSSSLLKNETGENFPPSKQRNATDENEKNKKTRDYLSEIAGVSNRTFDKARRVYESADEETKDQLRKGEKSIHSAYMDLKKTPEVEVKPFEELKGLSPHDIDQTKEEIISLGGVPADNEKARGISEFMMVKADVKRHLEYSAMKMDDIFSGLTELASTDENLDSLEGMIDDYCRQLKENLKKHRREER